MSRRRTRREKAWDICIGAGVAGFIVGTAFAGYWGGLVFALIGGLLMFPVSAKRRGTEEAP